LQGKLAASRTCSRSRTHLRWAEPTLSGPVDETWPTSDGGGARTTGGQVGGDARK
jgi:hypothetical protein